MAVINGCLAALRAAIKNSKINKNFLIGINILESQLSNATIFKSNRALVKAVEDF